MSLSLGRAVASLAAVMTLLSAVPISAQTNGMERRDQRRDVRDASRATKQACKAGDEKTRSECRQMKRGVKQAGRNDGGGNANAAPSTQRAQ